MLIGVLLITGIRFWIESTAALRMDDFVLALQRVVCSGRAYNRARLQRGLGSREPLYLWSPRNVDPVSCVIRVPYIPCHEESRFCGVGRL